MPVYKKKTELEQIWILGWLELVQAMYIYLLSSWVVQLKKKRKQSILKNGITEPQNIPPCWACFPVSSALSMLPFLQSALITII